VVAEWLPPTLVTLLGQEEDCLQQQKLPLVSGATYQGAGSLNFFKHYYSVYLELVAANKFHGQKKRRPDVSPVNSPFNLVLIFQFFYKKKTSF